MVTIIVDTDEFLLGSRGGFWSQSEPYLSVSVLMGDSQMSPNSSRGLKPDKASTEWAEPRKEAAAGQKKICAVLPLGTYVSPGRRVPLEVCSDELISAPLKVNSL